VPIRYHVKIKGDANPFLPEYDKYFSNRTKRREMLAKECRQITNFIINNKKSSKDSWVSPHRVGLKSA
jgi:RNA-directed DNA polymerase